MVSRRIMFSRCSLPVLQPALDDADDLLHLERLEQVVVGALLIASMAVSTVP